MGLNQLVVPVAMLLWRQHKEYILERWGKDAVRNVFLSSAGFAFSLIVLLFFRVSAAKDTKPVTVKKRNDKDTEVTEEITTQKYDYGELKKLVMKTLLAMLVGLFLEYKFDLIQPLVIQALMLPLGVLESALVKIHLLGYAAIGNLKRPFAEKNALKALWEKKQTGRTGASGGQTARRSSGGVVVNRPSSGNLRSSSSRSLGKPRSD